VTELINALNWYGHNRQSTNGKTTLKRYIIRAMTRVQEVSKVKSLCGSYGLPHCS
jgi:hypothetical protein